MSRKIDHRKNLVLFGLAVVTAGAIVHANQLVLELRIIERARPFLTHSFPARLQIFLLTSLLLTAAGLIIGTRIGLVCSQLGLVGVFVGHLGWFSYSYTMLHTVNQNGLYVRHPELVPPSLCGFIGARWWDLVLLILFAVLLVWEIKMLVTRVENRNRDEVRPKPMAAR